MTVTGIESVTKAKSRVYLEGQPAFVLYNRELSRYGIREGAELSEETYREIVDEVLTKRAKQRVMYLLKSMDRTEQQLRQKLREGGYPEAVIDRAVAYVQGFRYQDDRRYAGNYVEHRKGIRSRRQLEQELQRKGISRELAKEALEEYDPEDEREAIRSWMRKKRFSPEEATREECRRMYAFLLRKGFRMGDVLSALRMDEGYMD